MNRNFYLQFCPPNDPHFINVPRMLYKRLGSKVPQGVYQEGETGFLQRAWVVWEIVPHTTHIMLGRGALYANPDILHQGEPTMQLGQFEFVNDSEAAGFLFQAAAEEARKAGAKWLLGPLNGTTWNHYRFLTEKGTEPPFLGEPTHPDYYPELWDKWGFVPVGAYLSNLAPLDPATEKDADFWYRNNLRLETVLPKNLAQVLTDVYPLCSAAFAPSPFYSEITQEQFTQKLSAVGPLLQAGCTKVVYDTSGNAVAFALCYPDPLSQNRTILKTAARKKDAPVSGIIAALYREIAVQSLQLGRNQLVHAFIHEANNSATRSGHFGGETARRYTLFGKPV